MSRPIFFFFLFFMIHRSHSKHNLSFVVIQIKSCRFFFSVHRPAWVFPLNKPGSLIGQQLTMLILRLVIMNKYETCLRNACSSSLPRRSDRPSFCENPRACCNPDPSRCPRNPCSSRSSRSWDCIGLTTVDTATALALRNGGLSGLSALWILS